MKKVNRFVITVIILTLLASCDPILNYEYRVNNTSDKELTFQYQISTHLDSMTVAPQSNVQVYFNEVIGSDPHDEGDNFLRFFDSLRIEPLDTSELNVDYLQRTSWVYDRDITHFFLIKTGTNMYTLELSDDDFQ